MNIVTQRMRCDLSSYRSYVDGERVEFLDIIEQCSVRIDRPRCSTSARRAAKQDGKIATITLLAMKHKNGIQVRVGAGYSQN